MSDLRDSERRIESRHAEDEELRGELAVAKTRAEIKDMERRYGKGEVREMIRDGVVTLVKGAGKIRARRDVLDEHDAGDAAASALRDLNNPLTWGPKR